MNTLLSLSFVVALSFYLGIASKDVKYHYTLDGTDGTVPFAETILHILCGFFVTTILVVLLFGDWLTIPSNLRGFWLSFAPICLTATGLVDEFAFHRPRCRKDPIENWHHAVLHLSMGSTLVLGYARWY